MTGQDIITSVQGLLQDDQFPAVRIIEAANWLQNELFNNNHLRIAEASDIITASAGDTTADFPDDMQTLESLYLTVPTVMDLNDYYIGHKDFMERFANFSTGAVASQIRAWSDWSNAIRFSAPLSTDVSIACDYFRKPVPIVNLGDTCEIPNNYSEIISRGTLARVMEQNEDYAEAATERNNIAPLITTFIVREATGRIKTGATIIRTNQRRQAGRGAWSGSGRGQ